MSYTYTINVGDGVQKDFPFSFAGQDTGYLSPSNISVFVAGVQVGNFTIKVSSPNTVSFDVAPAIGAEVLIRRIMPKDVPYADFSRGNPFSQDTLNNTNLQMLYLIQEIYDGYLPAGFFFRVDIDMRGRKLINLGDGVADGDSVNMRQLNKEVVRNNVQDGRLTALEDNLEAGSIVNYFAQVYTAVGGELTVNTTSNLLCVGLYIDGLFQHKIAGAYSQVGGVITFPEPLLAGCEVYMLLGTSLPSDSLYATLESVAALQAMVDTINSNYAEKGANSSITSLSGLTTPLSVGQGGNGNNVGRSTTATKLDVPRGLKVNLASTDSVNFDGSTDVTPGVSGVLSKANGGTGNISGTADKLTTSRTLQTNLGSTSATSFDGSANNSHGVTGTLAVGNGGTGGNTVSAAQSSLDILPLTGKVDGVAVAAGKVGEVLSNQSTVASITSATYLSLTSLTLTPGDWDVTGTANIELGSGATATVFQSGINTVNNTTPPFPYGTRHSGNMTGGGQDRVVPTRRFSITTNTTIYLVCVVLFSGGTMSGNGYLSARRVR